MQSLSLYMGGDADKRESDFLAVLDVDRQSPTYTEVIATLPIGAVGTLPNGALRVGGSTGRPYDPALQPRGGTSARSGDYDGHGYALTGPKARPFKSGVCLT